MPPDLGRLDTALAPHTATVTFRVKVNTSIPIRFRVSPYAFPPPSSLGVCSTLITPHATTLYLAAHPGWGMWRKWE